MRKVTVLPFASLLFLLAACGPSAGDGNDGGDGDGDGDAPGTGGSGPSGGSPGDGDGDFPGTGGGGPSGGSPGDGDGDFPGTGGNGNTGICPPGSESLVLIDLMNSPPTPTPITPVPSPSGDTWFLEGPVWIDGALYVSQIRNYGDPATANILKYTPGGAVEEVIPDVGTNGLAVNAAGLIVAASHKEKGIVTIDPANLAAPPIEIVSQYNAADFNSPNDLTIRSDGTIYFTDPTWQCNGCTTQPVKGTYRASGGTVSLLTVSQTDPNGIALSPDENILYVGGNSLSAYPVNEDGSIGAGAPFGSGSTDGMTVDCAGNVYVTTGDASVKVFSPAGNELGTIAAAGARNVAFGGPENKTLYIVGIGTQPGAGVIYSLELNVPGFPY